MSHAILVTLILVASIAFTTWRGWRSYVEGQKIDRAKAATTSPAAQERNAEENSADLEDFLVATETEGEML